MCGFCPNPLADSFLIALPWPASFEMTGWRLAFVYEPILIVTVGFLLLSVDGYVGAAVMLGGVAALSVTSLQYQQYRNALLDRIDAQIESEMFSEALEGKPLKETKGFVVPGASQLSKAAVDLQQAREGLDPVLRDILEPKVDGAGPGVASAFGDVSGTTDGSPGEAESAPPRSSS